VAEMESEKAGGSSGLPTGCVTVVSAAGVGGAPFRIPANAEMSSVRSDSTQARLGVAEALTLPVIVGPGTAQRRSGGVLVRLRPNGEVFAGGGYCGIEG
jgi:hypothetical protein